jgi:hypothetical protein
LKNYYINAQLETDEERKIHIGECKEIPLPYNRIYLGLFLSCEDALKHAKKSHPNAN